MRKSSAIVTLAITVFVLQGILVSMASCVKVGQEKPSNLQEVVPVFPSLGPLSTEEQASGLQELGRTRQYVDLSRVGIWGWSGGGSNTLNAMFRKPDGRRHVAAPAHAHDAVSADAPASWSQMKSGNILTRRIQ